MAAVKRVVIPYAPRPQFQPYHDRSQRWAAIVAHRRAGKTVACVNDLIKAAVTCRKQDGRFAYLAPFYAQAKDVAWGYLKRFTAPLGPVDVRESDLLVDLPNGARIRLYGADNYDRLRGGYLDGVVLDEYGDMDPRAWSEVIRPMLSDRMGWATFIGTPKGRNHFAELFDGDPEGRFRGARHDPDWYCLTLKASESGLIDPSELVDAARTLSEDQYAQEYECSFDAAVVGAYYAKQMAAADADKRIARVPHDPAVPVYTAWDLGVGDDTAIWFAQLVGREVHIIDYLENNGVGLEWYAKELDKRPYKYDTHILPHDASARVLSMDSRTRVDTLRSLGLHSQNVLPRQNVDDGINAARLLIPRCWFDGERCRQGIAALRQYRRKFDEKRKVYENTPLHDWSSHAADAFRYLALGLPASSSQWSTPIAYPAGY